MTYFVSSYDFKRDSLIEEKEEFENTLKYVYWKENEMERKKWECLLWALGSFWGFGVRYYFESRKIFE